MARPRKHDDEKRTTRLPAVRLTEAERADLEAKADAAGVELSTFVRQCLLSAQVTPRPAPINAKFLVELNRIGVNIHQISRHLNYGGDADPQHIDDVLGLLRTTLERIGRDL